MFGYATRLIKRLIILGAGLFVIWIVTSEIFPALEDRLPLFAALSITYAIAAYGLIPLVVRVVRIFIRPTHVPLYCTTPDGFACDPINVGVVGTREQLTAAMEAAGWHLADSKTPASMFKSLISILLHRPYPRAPFSTLYLFGRKQDLGFQKPLANSRLGRHHVRFWASYSLSDKDEHHRHVTFWRRKTAINRDTLFWLGAASRDVGLGFIVHNAQFTHAIHPDTNAERELVINNLIATKRTSKAEIIRAGEPYELRNRSLGTIMIADGEIKLVRLRK